MRIWDCIVICKKILACVAQQLVKEFEKQPNIRYASGDPLYRWSFASVAVFPDQEARWLYDTTCG